jgi:hypothetical protein
MADTRRISRLAKSHDLDLGLPCLDAFEVREAGATGGEFRLLDDHVRDVILDREPDAALAADQEVALTPEGDLAHRADQQ